MTYLFHNLSHGAFYAACYRAALEAKQRYPQKEITLSLVVEPEELERLAGERKRPDLWTPARTMDPGDCARPIRGCCGRGRTCTAPTPSGSGGPWGSAPI